MNNTEGDQIQLVKMEGKGEEVGIKILRAAGRLKNKGIVGKSLKLDMKRGNQDFE